MLWEAGGGEVKVISNEGIVGTTAPGTNLPAHATVSNSVGAVTEIISAAANVLDSWGIYINISATSVLAGAAAAEASADILIGGATDDVLISSLLCGYSNLGTVVGGHQYFFPIHIPAGVRIAARLTSVRTAFNASIIIRLLGGSQPAFRVGRKVTTYGTKGSNSTGQAITLTNSGATPATFTEFTASTAENHFAISAAWQPLGVTAFTNGWVAIGAYVGAATEQRLGSWWYALASGEDLAGPIPCMPVFCGIPAGSRLTMAGSNSATTAYSPNGHIYAVS